jgi:hypothetical protein
VVEWRLFVELSVLGAMSVYEPQDMLFDLAIESFKRM